MSPDGPIADGRWIFLVRVYRVFELSLFLVPCYEAPKNARKETQEGNTKHKTNKKVSSK
jgi:hypothetical protein